MAPVSNPDKDMDGPDGGECLVPRRALAEFRGPRAGDANALAVVCCHSTKGTRRLILLLKQVIQPS